MVNGHLANRETMKDRGRVAECGETALCCRLFSKHLGLHVEVGALEEEGGENIKKKKKCTRDEKDSGAVNSRTRTVPPLLSFSLKDQCNVGLLII